MVSDVDHLPSPIHAYKAIATGKVPIETFRIKQFYINELQRFIYEEFTHFDTFAKQTQTELDDFLQKITTQREKILTNLDTLRGELVLRLNEIKEIIETNRYKANFEVVTKLDKYLAEGYLTSEKYSLQMFTGKSDLAGISDLLEKSVVYTLEPNRLLEEANLVLIPVLNDDNLRLFHPDTFEMTPIALSQSINLDQCTAYCYIGTDYIFSCGGVNHSQVNQIHISSGIVEKAPSMNSLRRYMGIWYTDMHIFVFGGYSNTHLNTAEKYGLDMNPWVNIANVMPKAMSGVSVCEHSSGLYLSGSDTAGTATVHFNLMTEVFQLMRYDPSFSVFSLICCTGDELYHIIPKNIETANLSDGPNGADFTLTPLSFPNSAGNCWQCCPMKRRGEVLLRVASFKSCAFYCFNPARSKLTSVFTFGN